MREVAAARETADPGPGREKTEREKAERNLRFNFRALVGHGLLGQTGFRLAQAPTFLPHFVSTLAGAESAAAVMRAVQSLGQFLSPVLSASIVEHRSRAKGAALVFGTAMRVQILFFGMIALLVPPESALPLVLLVAAMLGLAGGMQRVAFQFVLSKAIPAERRGILMGTRNAAAAATLVGVAWLGGWSVETYGFPNGYGYTFLAAFCLTMLGLGAFALVREPDSLERRPRSAVLDRVREIPGLLRAEPHFRRFLLARLVATAARGAMPLYIAYVGARFGVSGETLFILTTAFGVAQGVSGLVWGPLADRRGFKTIFVAALLTWMAGTLLLLAAPRIEFAYAVFGLLGAGLSGFMLASTNLVLEFGSERERPMRIATSNSISELVGAVGFAGAALIVWLGSLEAVLLTSVALQLVAVWLMRRVREPRTLPPPPLEELEP